MQHVYKVMVALLQMNGLQVNAPVPNEHQNCSADIALGTILLQ